MSDMELIIVTFCAGALAMECLVTVVNTIISLIEARCRERRQLAMFAAASRWEYPES